MTFAQLLTEIDRLSTDERLKLMEALTRSLQVDMRPTRKARRGSSLKRVRGILRPRWGKAPTDRELHDEYINLLSQKHQ